MAGTKTAVAVIGTPLPELARQIAEAHQGCEQALRVGLAHARAAGELLLRAKAQLPHGGWLPWLKANVRFAERTAQAYMHVAEEWPRLEANPQALADLTFEDAVKLLAAPPPAERVKARPAALPVAPDVGGDRWRVDCADCLDWFAAQPADSLDLVFGSPPYEDARTYGIDFDLAGQAWVDWMVQVYRAALRCCTGVVAFVVQGRTNDYSWSGVPFLLGADLIRTGVILPGTPPIYHRVGIPGAGGPSWFRNDYEFVLCATRGGRPPWSDNTAMGHEPKYAPGGDPSHRQQNGQRVNGTGYATMEERNNVGPHRARQQAGRVYRPPERANPGNVIACKVGGGNMGDSLCHENEAPFPELLAEWFVRSYCPPGGVTCDPFSGSGTTGAVAVRLGRRLKGCDLRQEQVDLSRRRIAAEAWPHPLLGTAGG